MSELNLILLGPPGAGKGTQAQRLREDFRLPYIATGDMFRAEKEKGTELGKKVAKYMDNGDLVPDELTIKLIVDFDPPKHDEKCDFDGARLVQREDDAPEKVKRRLEVYHRQTTPLIDYYEERGLLRRFDGTRDK